MDLNPLHSNAWYTAQRSVIGSMLIDPDHCAGMIFTRCKREHFSDASLLHVFDASRALWNENKPIDAVTVLNAAGGQYAELLRDCMVQTPTCANLGEYMDILHDCARLEMFRQAGFELIDAHTVEEAAAIYDRLGMSMMGVGDVVDLSWEECVSRYLDRMNDKTPPDFLPWGIPKLDQYLTVGKGQFVILAADASVGKTALALQFAFYMASHGKRVAFLSLETDDDRLTDRLMAERQVAAIQLKKSKWKKLTRYDFRQAMEVGQQSSDVPLRIMRKIETVEQLRSFVIMHKLDVVFIDYIQLLQGSGETRAEKVTGVSMALHRLAQHLGVVVVGLSQVTPPDKSRSTRLTKDDLRESRQLKQDADVIMLMQPYADGNPNLRELTIDKNKDDRTGRVLLSFDPQYMSFEATDPPGKPQPKPPKLEEPPDGEGGELPFD